jgi:glycosyltransferase involved in cell wall biosynthesis
VVPKVSIIAPCYRHESFLPDCLASVQAQTFQDWELILIDDQGGDQSVEIAKEASRQDSRIRVDVNPQNLGTYGTQQRALGMAQANLVAVLNTDDRWEPEKLELQTKALASSTDASFCWTLGVQIDREGKPDPHADVHQDWPRTPLGSLLPWLLHENRVLASGVVFRRQGLRFETSCRYSGDWVALIEASLRGLAACVPEPLTQWRVHGGNAHLMSEPRLVEEIRVREAILRAAPGWPEAHTPEGERRLMLAQLDILALYAAAGMKGKTWRLLPAALRHPRVFKRWAGSILPRKAALARLWPASAETFLSYRPKEMAKSLGEQGPLVFQDSP